MEVRARRDKWLAQMLENARGSAKVRAADKKCVAEMLLEDNGEGLTQRAYSAIIITC